jgi:hypothetical protein
MTAGFISNFCELNPSRFLPSVTGLLFGLNQSFESAEPPVFGWGASGLKDVVGLEEAADDVFADDESADI